MVMFCAKRGLLWILNKDPAWVLNLSRILVYGLPGFNWILDRYVLFFLIHKDSQDSFQHGTRKVNNTIKSISAMAIKTIMAFLKNRINQSLKWQLKIMRNILIFFKKNNNPGFKNKNQSTKENAGQKEWYLQLFNLGTT